jgi:REP element-mobilizing transposase RayT
MYHIVCPTKYRRIIFDQRIDDLLKEVCLEISERYEIYFIEIGADKDHVHFLVQSIPMYSPTKITRIIKSITAREIFKRIPELKKKLWGGEFWSKGFYLSTVGKYGNEEMISRYVKRQGLEKDYKAFYKNMPKPGQMTLWEDS